MHKVKSNLESGFTLIELLIVIGLMAMMMGLAVGFLGNSFSSQARKQSTRLISTIKYAYNEANVTGKAHRLVFDIEEQAYWLEVGPDKVIVSSENDETDAKESKKKDKKQLKEQQEKKEAAADEETDADTQTEEGAEDTPQLATEAAFSPVDSEVLQKVKLGETVFIRDVFVMHQKEIVESGVAYLYFFPTGLTEFAVIHLSNEEQDQNYSLIVNPLTGGIKVENDYIEYESLLQK